MVDYNLGTARGRIDIDASGARQGADESEQAANRATRGWQKHASSFTKVGASLTGAAALVGAGFAVSVKSAAEFEKQISGIAAVSGATTPELEAIRQKALQLGKDTQFSASEAAQAMEELVKAGVPLKDVLNGAADASVALAAAGGVDIPTAATLASNAMNQFGLTAKQLPKVVDQIAGAANASAIDVGDFGTSLAQVGAVAHLAGLDFNDTAVAIAEMGNAGIKGSDAGTSLKTFLQNLIPTTDKQKNLMRELGLVTKDGANQFFDAAGKTRPLVEIQDKLATALKGMSKEQKLAALQTLFGSDAIRAAAVLADNGAKGYEKMNTAMSKTSAADVAAKRMDNLAGKFEQFKGSLETAGIVIGTALLPALKSIVDFVTRLVNGFLSLSPGMQKTIIIIVGVTAAVVGIIGVVITFIGVLGAVLTALAPVAAMIGITAGALLGWVLVIPIIVAAVVALAIIIYKNFDKIKSFIIGVWQAIWNFLKGVWSAIVDGVKDFVEPIINAFVSAFNFIKNVVTTAFNIYKTIIMTVLGIIVTIITTYLRIWWTIVSTILNAIKAVFMAVFNTFAPLVLAVFNLIKAIIIFALTLIAVIVYQSLRLIWNTFVTIFNGIKAVVMAVFNFLKPFIVNAFNFYKNIIVGVLNFLKPYISAAFNFIKSVITTVFNAVKVVVSTVWGWIKSFISGAVGTIKAVIGTLSSIAGTIGGFFQSAYNAVKDKVASIISFVGGIGKKIVSAMGNVGHLLYDAGKKILQGLIDGMTSMLNKVTSPIKSATHAIGKFLPGSPVQEGPLRVLNNGYAGGQIMKMLIGGIEDQLPAIQATMGLAATEIQQPITTSVQVPEIKVPSQPAQPSQETPAQVVFDIKNYNPVAEKTSTTTIKLMDRVAALEAV